LSHALAETWVRREGRVLTVEGYRATGEIRGAVARSAEQLWGSLSSDEQARLRAVLLRLVVSVDNGEPVRAHLDRRRLDADPDRARVLDLLVRARLVTADESTVELAHEAAARAWPRLRAWLEDDAAGQRLMHHLTSASEEWERLGRPSSELYRGARLEAALEWRATNETDLTELERAFLDESAAAADSERRQLAEQARRQARQNKRLRWALLAAAVLLVATVAGGLVAVGQRQEAQDQRHQADMQRQEADLQRQQADEQRLEAERQREQADEQRLEAERQRLQADEQRLEADHQRRDAAISALVGDATTMRSNRRDLAALLAVEAYRLRPDAESESALYGTFTAAPGATQIVPTGRALSVLSGDAAFLADNRTVVFGDDFGAMHLVDLETGAIESLPSLSDKPGYPVWAVAGHGRYLAAGWREYYDPETGRFTVWDLETSEQRFAPVTIPFRIGDIAINDDGSIVAVSGGMEMRALTFDGASGEQLAEAERLARPEFSPQVPRAITAALRFAPDGGLAVGSQAGVLRLIDPRTGEERQRFEGPLESSNAHIEFFDGGRDILAAGGPIVRYDVETGAERWPARPPIDQCNSYVVAERIGALLCGQWSGRVIALDLETGAELGSRFDSQQGDVCGLAVSPDGTRLVEVTSCQGQNVTLVEWRLDGGGPVSEPVVTTTGERYVVGFGFDGPDDLIVEFADTEEAPLRTQVLEPAGVTRAEFDDVWAFFPTDDDSIAAVIYDDGVTPLAIGLYDTRRRAPAGPVIDPGMDFDGIWSDGQIVVLARHVGPEEAEAGEQNELRTYELATGRRVEPSEEWPVGPTVEEVAFGDDALYIRRFDPLGEREVRLVQRIDRASGAVLAESDPAHMYWALAANGETVVAATADGHVVELDAVTLEPTGAPFPGTNGAVGTLAIDDSGTRLLVRAHDDSLRFYDIPTRTQLGEPIDTDVGFANAALRGDGLAAAAVTGQGITIYDLDPAHWVEAACELAGRNMTPEEWDRYIGDLEDYRPTCPDDPNP
jgi:WD40 repeat protein